MTSRRLLLGVVLISMLGVACGRHRPSARVPRVPASSPERTAEVARPGRTETGYASWYGDPYHGRRAANGEIYDKHQLTAAHLTLPFDTVVKVVNLENGRSVVVRINDRGPFVKGRIIDLSQEAARQIAMIGPGTAMVRLEILSVNGNSSTARFAVQVGAFRDRSNAERLWQQLKGRYGSTFIQNDDSGQERLYRVQVGPKPSLEEAYRLAAQLERENLAAFVVRMEN